MRIASIVVLASLALAAASGCAKQPAAGSTGSVAAASPSLGDLRKVGDVHLETSCKPEVASEFERAVALLHSFFYDEARIVFSEVAVKDPECAMAQWGIAMTWWHPLWTPPTDEDMKAGVAAIERAKSIGKKNAIENGFIGALDTFYRTADAPGGPAGQTCHGPAGAGHLARAEAYEREMETLFAKHPEHVEVATFYALALLGAAPPADKTLAKQSKATRILEKFWPANRNHPGIAHYLIHGYDYPSLAAKGLPAAKAYAEMAPWVPHVLHMPSHIFTRLGMWPDVVGSNLASADAARQYSMLRKGGATWFEELHALDYLVYAYLQTGEDAKARSVVERVAAVKDTEPKIDFILAYATAAVPARYALERRQWREAANLTVREAPFWDAFPFTRGHVEFARALGAVRTGDIAGAKTAIARLEALAAASTDPRFAYFVKQTGTQVQAVRGFVAAAEGRNEEATRLLREAADTDDALGKHPVSPGSLLPVRELLADHLLEQGQPAEALAEYEASLALNPGRFNALYGAAVAAEKAGRPDVARRHYTAILAMTAPDADRPEIVRARTVLSKSAAAQSAGTSDAN